MKKEKGYTLIELLVTIALISLVASIGVPQIAQFGSNLNVKSVATDFIQNIKLARAMAIKENREYSLILDPVNNRYYIGHDGDGDKAFTNAELDTFGICDPSNFGEKDSNGISKCVKTIDLTEEYGKAVRLDGPLLPTIPPNKPDSNDTIEKSIALSGESEDMRIPVRIDGSVPRNGKIYFQHEEKGYTYCIKISNYAGKMDLFKWQGDIDKNDEKEWVEVR